MSNRRLIDTGLLVAALVASSVLRGPSRQSASAQVAPEPSATAPAVPERVGGGSLKLSAEKDSAAARFCFVLESYTNESGVLEKAFDVVVGYEDGKRAVLVRYADGLPYAYFADGVGWTFDAGSGSVKVLAKGRPRFLLRAAGVGGIEVKVAHGPEAVDGPFLLDVGSMLAPTAGVERNFDPATGALLLKAPASTNRFYVDQRAARGAFPIERVVLQDKRGNVMTIGGFRLDARPPVKLFGVGLRELKDAKVTVEEMTEHETKMLSPFPPVSVLPDADARKAAAELRPLFERAEPRGAPAAGPKR